MKKALIAAAFLIFAAQAFAGTEWQVKKPAGTATTRNSLQYKATAGTKCEPEVVDQSSTGTVKYHLVPIKTTLGVTIKVPFECVLVAVPDPVPPVVVPPVVVPPPVVTPVLTDFAARCGAPGVVKCVGFDSLADISGGGNFGVAPNQSGVKPAIDTAVKASGSGSLMFTIPSNSGADSSGIYWTNFSPDLLTQFGENSEFYVQWRQRFSPEFITTPYQDSGGWKQIIVGSGDQPGKIYSSCSDLETVVQNSLLRGFPQMYNSCSGSASHGPFAPFEQPFVSAASSSDFKLQNARGAPFCLYSASKVGTQFPPTGNCFGYFPNEWMTFQVGIKTGPRVGNEWKGSVVSLWIAREGRPSELAFEYPIALSAGDPALDQRFGKVWLLPYQTRKNSSQVHPAAFTWYDELIVSRTRIADPSSMTVIVPAPAPVGPPVVTPPVVAPPPGTTALSTLAASMAPGTWAELVTSNITPTLDNLSGASGMMTGYTDSLVWDTAGEQAFTISADHLAPEGPQFASYSALSNTWQRLPRPAWLSSLTFFHGYAHTAIDAANRVLYHRPYGQNTVHRYDIATQAWTTLPAPNFVNTYANCCDALTYFPELGGLVWIRGVAEVWLFKESTKAWAQLGKWGVQANNGGTWTFARYNPVAKVVVFGSGNSGDLYKLDSGGSITQLKNPPVPIYDGSAGVGVLTADTVSGQFLFLSPTSRNFYSYDIAADTWQAQASPTKPAMTNLGVVATPVPEYGVNLFAACSRGSCRAYLYKHK